jgi:hypothetical protein
MNPPLIESLIFLRFPHITPWLLWKNSARPAFYAVFYQFRGGKALKTGISCSLDAGIARSGVSPHWRWCLYRLWQDILAAAADGMSRRGRRQPCVCHNLLKEITE